MSWLEKILPKSKITTPRRHNIPEGVWTKCTACEQMLYRAELERNLEAVSYTHLTLPTICSV